MRKQNALEKKNKNFATIKCIFSSVSSTKNNNNKKKQKQISKKNTHTSLITHTNISTYTNTL